MNCKIDFYLFRNKKHIKHTRMSETKYSKKAKFTREKQHVCSEADINRIDKKQKDLKIQREIERINNKMISDGKIQVVEEKPASGKKIKKVEEKEVKKNGGYEEDIFELMEKLDSM